MGWPNNYEFLQASNLSKEERVPMADAKSEVIFQVSNHHVESCGKPPVIDGDAPNMRHSYYENVHGEQLIFTYNTSTKEALLYHGDAGWKPYAVIDGYAGGLILADDELTWLRACWQASKTFY
jgi:hypothetical protein